jgi:hypothetical protein
VWSRCIAAIGFKPVPAQALGAKKMLKLTAFMLAASLWANFAWAAAGDAYVYRVLNGYNSEVRGTINYRVERSQLDLIEVAVTTAAAPGYPGLDSSRTEIYATNGNWLRHALASHDQMRDFEFTRPLPVYVPPADAGSSWSARVDALEPVSGRRNSVRVDGKIAGNERITVPAGTFDTIKIVRRTYVGDWDGFLRETQIEDTDWYAPALGRPVKSDSKSSWQDLSRCTRGGCPWFRGDWNIVELAEFNAAKR